MEKFSSELMRGSLDLMVLSILSDGPKYGYLIQQRLREASRDMARLQAGTLYPLLHRLEADKLIRSRWDAGTGRRRKWYELSAAGRARLKLQAHQWQEYAECLRALWRPSWMLPVNPLDTGEVVMPEHEFELYLSLLTRFMRLDAAQREQIADELRDHFDERFEELLASGKSREEAIQATLDEFGDAAGLAAHFSHIGNRRRRTIMRRTFGVGAGLMAAGVLVTLLMETPAPMIPGPARAVAQQPIAPKSENNPVAEPARRTGTSAVDAKLDSRRVNELNFVETPLKDVLEVLSDANEVDILINKRALEDQGLAEDVLITLQVKRTAVTARTALELVLEQVSGELGYTVRDGIVYITQKYDNDEIQVYNVRDLLQGFPTVAPGVAGAGGMGAMPGMGAGGMPGGLGGEMGEGGFGGGGGGPVSPPTAGESLVGVIESTVFPDTWGTAGGTGSVAEFNGLLIVKQSQIVHREIKQLLEMMREVDRRSAGAP